MIGVAVDPSGSTAYAVLQSANVVAVLDLATATVTAKIRVGAFPVYAAVHPDGTRVYVTNRSDNTVSVIDTASRAVVATVPVGPRPEGIHVHPDGTRAYIANALGGGTISVLDTAANAVVGTVSVGSAPLGLCVEPRGRFLYAAVRNANRVAVIDTATNAVTATVPVTAPHALGQFILASTAYLPFGTACAGSSGAPSLRGLRAPRLGKPLLLEVRTSLPFRAGVLLTGASNQSWMGLPLPFGLGILGAPGCTVYASGEVQINFSTGGTGVAQSGFGMPADASLLGAAFYNQALVVDLAANALGVITSNAAQARIGL